MSVIDRQSLFDIWTRYIHRTDIEADLDAVLDFADEKIAGALKFTTVTPPETEDDKYKEYSSLYLHAGLIYLHNLAQDNDGVMRETSLFNEALNSTAMRVSLTNRPVATMSRPYYPTDEASDAP